MSTRSSTRSSRLAAGWIEENRARARRMRSQSDGRVWLTDPIDADGLEERIRSLGEPAGVIQLLDRHKRDGAALARATRRSAPRRPASLPGTPFRFLPVLRGRWWKEVALWWPERRILVCADALGTIQFFRAGDEPAGLHPFLRAWPPARSRARARAPARRTRRGCPPSSGGARERLANGRRRIPSGSSASRAAARGALARAGEQARAGRAAAAPSGPRHGPAG